MTVVPPRTPEAAPTIGFNNSALYDAERISVVVCNFGSLTVGLAVTSIESLGMMGMPVALIVVAGTVVITMVEIFVAFLQAFIFTYLTALFIGMSVNVHHDEEHAH